jgi:ribosomal protein L37AE/L43A
MTDRTQMMTLRDCPRCLRLSLNSTGAFWSCAACGYAIIQRALEEEVRGNPGSAESRAHGAAS